MKEYIYQYEDWPNFIWNINKISNLLAEVRNKQGRLIGKMETPGFDLQSEAFLEILTTDILKSNEIEGIVLNIRCGSFVDSTMIRYRYKWIISSR